MEKNKVEKLVLEYVGRDSFDRPVYKNKNKLFVDVEPREEKNPEICTKLNNYYDGEPDTPICYIEKYRNMEIEFIPERVTR